MSNLLKTLERRISTKTATTSMLSKEASANIRAVAGEFTKIAIDNSIREYQLEDEAIKIASTLDGEDLVQARIFEAYGRGMARGFVQGKVAGFDEGVGAGYGSTMDVVRKLAGDENAAQLEQAMMAEGGDPQVNDEDMAMAEQAFEEAKAQAMEMLIEQAGGIEAVQQNPELMAQIEELAEQVAAETVDELTSGGQPEAGAQTAPVM